MCLFDVWATKFGAVITLISYANHYSTNDYWEQQSFLMCIIISSGVCVMWTTHDAFRTVIKYLRVFSQPRFAPWPSVFRCNLIQLHLSQQMCFLPFSQSGRAQQFSENTFLNFMKNGLLSSNKMYIAPFLMFFFLFFMYLNGLVMAPFIL